MTITLELTKEVTTQSIETITPFSITVNKKELVSALKLLGKVVSDKPTHEILRCVLVEFSSVTRVLNLTTFDLSTQVCVGVAVQPDLLAQDVSFCAEFKLLRDLVNSLNMTDISIMVQSNKLTINKGKSSYELPIIKPEDFPTIPEVDGLLLSLDKDCIDKLAQASSFASSDYAKQILMGVNIKVEAGSDSLNIQSSDSSRIFSASKSLPNQQPESISMTMPTLALDMLKSLDGDVTANFKDDSITFSTDSTTITTRLLAGSYPNISAAIAMQCNPTRFVSFDKSELLSALNVAKLFSAVSTGNLIIINFALDGEGNCEIKPSKPTGDGRTCSEDVGVIDNGSEALTISLDHAFLSSILGALPQKRVRFEITNRTAVVRFVGLDDEAEPVTGCELYLMPIDVR